MAGGDTLPAPQGGLAGCPVPGGRAFRPRPDVHLRRQFRIFLLPGPGAPVPAAALRARLRLPFQPGNDARNGGRAAGAPPGDRGSHRGHRWGPGALPGPVGAGRAGRAGLGRQPHRALAQAGVREDMGLPCPLFAVRQASGAAPGYPADHGGGDRGGPVAGILQPDRLAGPSVGAGGPVPGLVARSAGLHVHLHAHPRHALPHGHAHQAGLEGGPVGRGGGGTAAGSGSGGAGLLLPGAIRQPGLPGVAGHRPGRHHLALLRGGGGLPGSGTGRRASGKGLVAGIPGNGQPHPPGER